MTLLIAPYAPISAIAQAAWINVKSEGATGNGTTNDTAAIQKAITAATSSAQTRTVYFPCGTYAFTGLTITAPVILQGDNNVCSILKYTPTSGAAITENFGSGDGQSPGIRDLTIAGPDSNYSIPQNTLGLKLGGTNGAAGFLAQRVAINFFGTGLTYGNNAYLTVFESSLITQNVVDFVYPTGLTNSGENLQFTNTLFAEGGQVYNNSLGPGIEIQGGAELSIIGGSLDDCSLDIANGAGAIVKLTDVHVEWPGGALNAPLITMEDSWSMISMESPYFYLGTDGSATSEVAISAGRFNGYSVYAVNGGGTNLASLIALSGTASAEIFGVGKIYGYTATATNSGSGTLKTY